MEASSIKVPGTVNIPAIKVSMFANAKALTPKVVGLMKVLSDIQTGSHVKQVTILRELLKDDRKSYDLLKTNLPAFTMSGIASSRTEMAEHSNLVQVDLDKLGGDLAAIRSNLRSDPFVALGFVSPSGKGLKLGVVIDGSRHKESYLAVEQYFLTKYKLTIDPACKDLLRLCFVSHDPELWINHAATSFQMKGGGEERGYSTESCILHDCVTESLHPCTSASLHNTSPRIVENIKARNEAKERFGSKSPAHSKLVRLYDDLIELRYKAKAHTRNHFITQAVPFLYRAVAALFVVDLVCLFYDCNRALFQDSREQHLKEARAMLKSVTKSYIESLNTEEREICKVLDEHSQDAFRICRDLALLPEPKRDPYTFFLGFEHLGDRLGIHPMQAQRIMRRFEIDGLLQQLKKGTRRAAGVRGEAGTYRWQVSLAGKPIDSHD